MARQLSPGQMEALVKLLGDGNEGVVKMARERLMEAEDEAIPYLIRAAASQPDAAVRGRARLLLEEVRFAALQRRLARLSAGPDERFDLEEGLFIVARTRYPDLDEEPYRRRLAQMAEELAHRRVARVAPTEAAAVVNRYLFGELGLRSNESRYYDPDNVCVNQVLDRRVGISISVAAVYVLVASRAGFMVHGVSLPGRFVVGVDSSSPFWLDPTRGGRVLSRHDLVAIAREAGHQFDETMLEPVGPRELTVRLLTHLMRVYSFTSQVVWAQRVEQLLRIANRKTGPSGEERRAFAQRSGSSSPWPQEGRPG